MSGGHFVGVSGRHMDAYINKDALFPHVGEASLVGKMFAEKNKNSNIDVVAAPALGGIILAQWTAHHLLKIKKKEVLAVFTEKTADGGQVFKRGYGPLIKNRNVLVIEDSTTTGGSVKKVVDAVRNAGGRVIRVCVMVNRDPKIVNKKTIGAPFSALAVYRIKSYEEKDCPLCKKGMPINMSIGHGKDYANKSNR